MFKICDKNDDKLNVPLGLMVRRRSPQKVEPMKFKNYIVQTELYRNAHTVVYRALSKISNQTCILKLLDKEFPSQSELARLQHEFRINQNLKDAGIPKCLNFLEEENRFYLVFESTPESQSLKDLLKQRSLPLQEILEIAIQLCDILNKVHSQHILHKDIKPANIVFDPVTGRIQLTDFGIASELESEKKEAIAPRGSRRNLSLYFS